MYQKASKWACKGGAEGGDGVDANTDDRRVSAAKRGGGFAALIFGWPADILPRAVCSRFGVGVRVRLPVPPRAAADEASPLRGISCRCCASGLGVR